MTFRRLAGISLATLSMHLATHLVAFAAIPLGLILAALDPAWTVRLKWDAATLFLGLAGKTWQVKGLENVDPQNAM
jgi:hypothetical protein